MRIACWSGPRNISTALMRSWSSREDTCVIDEPLYAYYLKKTNLKHPMSNEIIEKYPNKLYDIKKLLTSSNPESKPIWYQKHMAHHIIDLNNIDFINEFENTILIRHPKKVINSYINKNRLNNIMELGYPQQYHLIKYLFQNNKDVLVIDSQILLDNPEKILKKWCSNLKIDFDKNMLKWNKGLHRSDGIWAKHWYNSVIKSETFDNTILKKDNHIQKEYHLIYKESMVYYNKMIELVLR